MAEALGRDETSFLDMLSGVPRLRTEVYNCFCDPGFGEIMEVRLAVWSQRAR